jgi:hypothetical protein
MILYSYWSKHISPTFNLFESEEQALISSVIGLESLARSYSPFSKAEAPSILEEIQDQFDRVVAAEQQARNQPQNGENLAQEIDWAIGGPQAPRRLRNQRQRDNVAQKAKPLDSEEYIAFAKDVAAFKANRSMATFNKVIDKYNVFMDKVMNNPSLLHSVTEVKVHEEE